MEWAMLAAKGFQQVINLNHLKALLAKIVDGFGSMEAVKGVKRVIFQQIKWDSLIKCSVISLTTLPFTIRLNLSYFIDISIEKVRFLPKKADSEDYRSLL